MKTNPNEPAMPYTNNGMPGFSGMDIRTHIAAMAMQALATNNTYCSPQDIAKDAVSIADALIAELNKEKI